MTVADIKERLRELIDEHPENERGRIMNADLLLDKLYRLELEIERAILLGHADV